MANDLQCLRALSAKPERGLQRTVAGAAHVSRISASSGPSQGPTGADSGAGAGSAAVAGEEETAAEAEAERVCTQRPASASVTSKRRRVCADESRCATQRCSSPTARRNLQAANRESRHTQTRARKNKHGD